MTQNVPLLSVLGVSLRAYGLCLALAAVAALCMIERAARRRGLPKGTGEIFTLLAVPLCVICARAAFLVIRRELLAEFGLGFAFKLWLGGFAFWGAVSGALLAALLCARIVKRPFAAVADCAAPGAAVALAIARFAEGFTAQGTGAYIQTEVMQFFPLCVSNEWGEWYLAVFVLEGLAALVAAFCLTRGDKRAPGDALLRFLLLVGASQVLFESMRQDEFLRVGFVRVNQVFAMGMALFAYFAYVKRARLDKKRLIAACALAVVALGVCVGMEFAIDKSQEMPVPLCRAIIAACMAAVVAVAYRLRGRRI